jgi:hypothetical protein
MLNSAAGWPSSPGIRLIGAARGAGARQRSTVNVSPSVRPAGA